MKKIVLLLSILILGSSCYAQKTELVSVLELNKVLSDYYKNLNVYCSDSSNRFEKDLARTAVERILTAQLPTNLYPEMKPELGILSTDKAIVNYLSLAKDSIVHWEYKILHFNAKYVQVNTITLDQEVCYTAQLIVCVTCTKKNSSFHTDQDCSVKKSVCAFSNIEQFTFVMDYNGVWRIIRTDPTADYRLIKSKHGGYDMNKILDPETQFEMFKYQYIEKYVDTLLYSYNVAIVHDSSDNVGLVDLSGLEIVPTVFDSIQTEKSTWTWYAYKAGWSYVLDWQNYNYEERERGIFYGSIGNKKYTPAGNLYDIEHRDNWGCSIPPLWEKVREYPTGRLKTFGYVSDKPVTWGMWIRVMGGRLPKGCLFEQPVTGMKEEDIKVFRHRINHVHQRPCFGSCYSTTLWILDSNNCAQTEKDDRYLWLWSVHPFSVMVRWANIYDFKTHKVDFKLNEKYKFYPKSTGCVVTTWQRD